MLLLVTYSCSNRLKLRSGWSNCSFRQLVMMVQPPNVFFTVDTVVKRLKTFKSKIIMSTYMIMFTKLLYNEDWKLVQEDRN